MQYYHDMTTYLPALQKLDIPLKHNLEKNTNRKRPALRFGGKLFQLLSLSFSENFVLINGLMYQCTFLL